MILFIFIGFDMYQNNNKMRFRSVLILITIIIIIIISWGCISKNKKNFTKTYYPSGELKSYGFFIKDSIPIDTLITLFKNGKKSSVEIFSDSGNAIKSFVYYGNGNLKKLINYEQGLANGFFLTYDSAGKILNRTFYYNDSQIGDAYFYYPDSLIYNFYDWDGDNISQIVYDSHFNIIKDQRQVIFIDSVKFSNDTTVKNNKLLNRFQQDLSVIVSNPPKCKTDLIIKYFSKKNNLIEKDSSTKIQAFHKKSYFSDSLATIVISGKEYDSITQKTTYQSSTKTLSYDVKLISGKE